MYKVFVTKNVDKLLAKLPKEYQIQFAKLIQKLVQDPFMIDIKKLGGGHKISYRLRMGAYRIFITIKFESKKVIIYDIRRRTTTTYQ